jgi:hypothetical protein
LDNNKQFKSFKDPLKISHFVLPEQKAHLNK